jgi:hypothetical protein
MQKDVVIHEIGHSIGWFHEQSRPDRDNYVKINVEHLHEDWRYQYRKVTCVYMLKVILLADPTISGRLP